MAITLETLSQWFLQSLSPDAAPRRLAESSLSSTSLQSGFSVAVLRLISDPSSAPHVCHATAVHFKNHLCSRWSPRDVDPLPIPDSEKEKIKALLLSFLLSSPPPIQSQLSESLTLISSHDFPHRWPSLLPELVSLLRSSPSPASTICLLSAVNSVFKKFRSSYDTIDTRLDLKYCLDNFVAPLLDIFLKTARALDAALASASSLESILPLFESQCLCCRIFFSLVSIELPEFFEDHMREWMTEFRNYLTTAYPAPVEVDGKVDELCAAICENLQLYMEKNEEEFHDYLEGFASMIRTLLMNPSKTSSRDQLTITAMKFLTTVSTSIHYKLFGNPGGARGGAGRRCVLGRRRLEEEEEEDVK